MPVCAVVLRAGVQKDEESREEVHDIVKQGSSDNVLAEVSLRFISVDEHAWQPRRVLRREH